MVQTRTHFEERKEHELVDLYYTSLEQGSKCKVFPRTYAPAYFKGDKGDNPNCVSIWARTRWLEFGRAMVDGKINAPAAMPDAAVTSKQRWQSWPAICLYLLHL